MLNEEVLVDFGRFGPYIKCGSETRSLEEQDDVFEVTLERASALLRQEKKGGWRSRTPKVLKELRAESDDLPAIKVLNGRYGPYLTDGTTNAPAPKGKAPEDVTLEEALQLIAERAAQPKRAKKKKTKKAKKKSTAKKKTAKKSSTKKTTTKKAATKKTAAKKKTAKKSAPEE